MDKKKIIAIVVFIALGLFIFTFANPAPSSLDPVEVPGQGESDDESKDEVKGEEEKDEEDEPVGNVQENDEQDEVDYYQLALDAIIKAEQSLIQGDVDSAKDLVEDVDNNKEDLIDRVENVQNVIDYNKLLTELENKTNSSTNKDELNTARDYNTTTDLANKLASLNDDANKEKLLNRYNVLLPKLNDTTPPVVTGLDKEYTNQIVNLTITDESSFTATLNGENYISGTEIPEDGVYKLVAVDSSFNDTVITFTIDTTKPTFNYTNGKIVKEGTLVFDDANFDYIKLYNHITKETEIIYANEFVFDGNINVDNLRYDITGCDKAGNCTSTFNLYHDTTKPVVSGTAKIGSKEVKFINGGTYKKVTLNITDGSLKEVILLNNNEVLKTFKDNFNSSIKMEFEQIFIEDGNYKIKAIDRAGNYEIIEFTIDNQKPIVNGIKDGEYYQSVVITVDDTSKLGSMHFKRNGKKYNYELGTELKEDGNYSFYITDVAGNKSEVINFVIDNNPADYDAVNFNVVSGYNDHNGTYFYATFGDVIYAHIRTNEVLRENPTFTLTIGNEKIVLSGDKVNFKDEEKEEYTYLYSINYELPQEERFENLQNVEVKLEISNVVDKAGNVTLDKKTQQNIINITNSNKVFIDTTAPEISSLSITGGTRNKDDNTYYANAEDYVYVYAVFNEKLNVVPTLKIEGKEYIMDSLYENNGTYRYYSREVKAENLEEGLVNFEVYGYKDMAGNEGRKLENKDITLNSQSKVIVDTIAPTISISGTEGLNKNEYRIESGTPITLEDMLAIATDASFGGEIKIEPKKVDFLAPGSVLENNIYNYDYKTNGFDTRKVGRYDIYYQVTDKAGNVSEEKLMMLVMTDTTAPTVVINGERDVFVEYGSKYTELGATMTDNVDTTITNLQPTKIILQDLDGNFIKNVTETGVDANVIGRYIVYYDYTDKARNSSKVNGLIPFEAQRIVTVRDTKAPKTKATNIKIEDESNDKKEYFAKNGDVISVYVRFNEQLKQKPTFKLINNGRELVFDESDVTVRNFENGEYQYSVNYKITEGNGMTDGEITMHISNIEDLYGNKAEDIVKPTNGHIVYLDNTLKYKTLGIGKNGNPATVSQYVKNGDSIRVLIYFDEELAVLPKVKIKGIEYDTHFAPDSSNPEIGNYAYHLDLDITEDLGLDEGLITFEVYGYEDKAGNKVSEPLTNEDITYTNRLSAVYYDKTDVEAKLLYILARDDANYRFSISNGEYLRVEANFNEELQELPTLTVGSQSMKFNKCNFNSDNSLYVCVADMKINNEIAKLVEGEVIPFEVTNVKDLAGNETSFDNSNVTKYYQNGKLIYDQVKYENPFVSMTFHNSTNYKLNEENGNNDLSLTEAKIGDNVRVFVRFNQDLAIDNFKPVIVIGGVTKKLKLSNVYSDGTKDYGTDVTIIDEMNLTPNKKISFVIKNIVLENGNTLPNLTQNDITSNTLSGVTYIED